MVVAFSRRGSRDTIMFDRQGSFEVQRREHLRPIKTVIFEKKDNENAYDEAEEAFDFLDALNK